MSAFPEPGRVTGQVLLDVVSAYSVEGGPQNAISMQLAMDSIAHTDAVIVDLMDDGTAHVDASNLVMPAVVLLNWLLENHVAADQREVAIADMRAYLDS